ncbi:MULTISPECIES: outer membrane protein assembly factor BamE [Methylophaga]|uniref:Outer membrane protein assembly factor BamE n=1 Tax=Methylophaga muralis TaxID=291169 RepID=A0A1E3GV06_9GAMM|nr:MULTISPECIES: outer membrane protein assembly factor BamE [Methylophaga]ODN67191.1 Outer membrane protein assembly factor BamE precursor [Methylophaga muralis]THF69685.1 MAG: outer membrane protein assembly factor BamE [Methylophaga nitratireducenticrescens]THK40378.1 outer membrane protein assembly factor BamE [Methylophaga sp. SB9B]
MKSLLIYSLSLVILTLSACSKDKIPGVYRIDIQQGNQVTQEMLSKLEPGMTKSQVSFVMGTPMLIDVFHPNRWDYLYSFQPGSGPREQRRITLYFDDEETLDYVDGNTRIVESIQLTEEQRTDTNVVVPLTEQKTGFFNSILNLIGLGEEKVETIDETDPALVQQKEALPETSREPMGGQQPAGQIPDIQ